MELRVTDQQTTTNKHLITTALISVDRSEHKCLSSLVYRVACVAIAVLFLSSVIISYKKNLAITIRQRSITALPLASLPYSLKGKHL